MHRWTTLIAVPIVCTGLAAAADDVVPNVIGFDDLVHGEIVTDQFAGMGLTFDFVNSNKKFNIGAAFDTTRSGTRDPDLENPWTMGNLAPSTDLGRVLIIAENNRGAADGILDRPDDEGRRPGGSITLAFDQAIRSFGLDIVDIEGPVIEGSALVFSLGGDEVGRLSFGDLQDRDDSIVFGDRSANRVAPITADELGSAFDRVMIEVGGSSGYDNLNWVVPTPGSAALLGLGGLLAARRRR